MRLIFFKWRKGKPLLIFKGKGHTKENIELKASKDAFFQAMLILKYHSFGKRLFSSHAYFKYALIIEKIRYLYFSIPISSVRRSVISKNLQIFITSFTKIYYIPWISAMIGTQKWHFKAWIDIFSSFKKFVSKCTESFL